MEITDRTLLIMTGITIFVVLGGVLTILIKTGGGPFITGFASYNVSTNGTVKVNVQSTVAISLIESTNFMDFGAGSLIPSPNTNYTFVNTSASPPGGFSPRGPFKIRNDGDVDVNITINGTTAANFLGGSAANFSFQSNPTGSGALNSQSDGCVGNRSNNDTGGIFDIVAAPKLVCTNLSFTNGADVTNISIFLKVPSDVATGAKHATVQFIADCVSCATQT